MNRKPIFDAAKALGARFRSSVDVAIMDSAIDVAMGKRVAMPRRMSPEALDEMKQFEGLSLVAYPDPGSGGEPWTIGYGATGPEIRPGLRWTAQQAHDRLVKDVARFEDGVTRLLGNSPTTQGQFDALVSFAYNVGLDEDDDTIAEGLGDSTLLKLHKRGDYAGAADQFRLWNRAAGHVMKGLTRRRAAEAARYRGDAQ